ncbi:MAG: MlaE family lipid ABC transporter permease subunit [Alphaproteobacteria bacterium]|nr:MAG: MlaE family lipid ABC transporter permease subunit [Alphaproteobacteria bacterium]
MTAATLDHQWSAEDLTLQPIGAWVIESASGLELALRDASGPVPVKTTGRLVIDLGGVIELDTAGAFLLVRLERAWQAAGGSVEWRGGDSARQALINRIRAAIGEDETMPEPPPQSIVVDVGETVLSVGADMQRYLRILGAVIVEGYRSLVGKAPFRSASMIKQMEYSGLRAVPIILLMSFLNGGILAQQSAFQLRFFGAEIFAVDLVGILALREVAILLTAIMVAGRSGSAITAELGSMQMREEIDALRVMGMNPINVLVLPRVVALILVLPLLTFLSDIMTLFGAMLTLWFYSDIPPNVFLSHLRTAIDFSTFFSGLIKAPFMALIIGLVACTEGMAVRGSAESLGRHTTASVVKSIFLVVVVDGVFAIFYAAIDF